MTDPDPPVAIRLAEAADVPALQRVRAAAFAPIFAGFRAAIGPDIAAVALGAAEAEQAALLDRLAGPEAEGPLFVAMGADGPVGLVAVRLDDARKLGEVVLFAVAPHATGGGVGGKLLERALAAMRAAGMTAASVGVGGDKAHAPARRAYARAGFGPSLPALWLYRML